MKSMLFCVILYICSFAQAFAGQWVAYTPSVVSPPVVEVPAFPTATYRTALYPVYEYQWVPYYYNVPIDFIEYRLFCQKRRIIFVPQINWVLQPVYR